jgi:hypothetical protein
MDRKISRIEKMIRDKNDVENKNYFAGGVKDSGTIIQKNN